MKGHHQFTPDMKKILVLSMLVSLAMICSCQKKDSAAEQQLAQRKTELDAHQEALDERMNGLQERVNALDERVNALAEKQEATMNAPPNPTGVQGQISVPAQVEAEKQRIIQQLSTMIPHTSQVDKEMSGQGESQNQKQYQLQQTQKAWGSSGAVFPAPEAISPTPSPAVEATSPTPSLTP